MKNVRKKKMKRTLTMTTCLTRNPFHIHALWESSSSRKSILRKKNSGRNPSKWKLRLSISMSWMTATQKSFSHRETLSKQSSSTLTKNSILKRQIKKRLIVLIKIYFIDFNKLLDRLISMKDFQIFPSHMNQRLHNMINSFDLVTLKNNFTSKKNKW